MLRIHDVKFYIHKHNLHVWRDRGEHVVNFIDWREADAGLRYYMQIAQYDTMLKLDNPPKNHMTIGGET